MDTRTIPADLASMCPKRGTLPDELCIYPLIDTVDTNCCVTFTPKEPDKAITVSSKLFILGKSSTEEIKKMLESEPTRKFIEMGIPISQDSIPCPHSVMLPHQNPTEVSQAVLYASFIYARHAKGCLQQMTTYGGCYSNENRTGLLFELDNILENLATYDPDTVFQIGMRTERHHIAKLGWSSPNRFPWHPSVHIVNPKAYDGIARLPRSASVAIRQSKNAENVRNPASLRFFGGGSELPKNVMQSATKKIKVNADSMLSLTQKLDGLTLFPLNIVTKDLKRIEEFTREIQGLDLNDKRVQSVEFLGYLSKHVEDFLTDTEHLYPQKITKHKMIIREASAADDVATFSKKLDTITKKLTEIFEAEHTHLVKKTKKPLKLLTDSKNKLTTIINLIKNQPPNIADLDSLKHLKGHVDSLQDTDVFGENFSCTLAVLKESVNSVTNKRSAMAENDIWQATQPLAHASAWLAVQVNETLKKKLQEDPTQADLIKCSGAIYEWSQWFQKLTAIVSVAWLCAAAIADVEPISNLDYAKIKFPVIDQIFTDGAMLQRVWELVYASVNTLDKEHIQPIIQKVLKSLFLQHKPPTEAPFNVDPAFMAPEEIQPTLSAKKRGAPTIIKASRSLVHSSKFHKDFLKEYNGAGEAKQRQLYFEFKSDIITRARVEKRAFHHQQMLLLNSCLKMNLLGGECVSIMDSIALTQRWIVNGESHGPLLPGANENGLMKPEELTFDIMVGTAVVNKQGPADSCPLYACVESDSEWKRVQAMEMKCADSVDINGIAVAALTMYSSDIDAFKLQGPVDLKTPRIATLMLTSEDGKCNDVNQPVDLKMVADMWDAACPNRFSKASGELQWIQIAHVECVANNTHKIIIESSESIGKRMTVSPDKDNPKFTSLDDGIFCARNPSRQAKLNPFNLLFVHDPSHVAGAIKWVNTIVDTRNSAMSRVTTSSYVLEDEVNSRAVLCVPQNKSKIDGICLNQNNLEISIKSTELKLSTKRLALGKKWVILQSVNPERQPDSTAKPIDLDLKKSSGRLLDAWFAARWSDERVVSDLQCIAGTMIIQALAFYTTRSTGDVNSKEPTHHCVLKRKEECAYPKTIEHSYNGKERCSGCSVQHTVHMTRLVEENSQFRLRESCSKIIQRNTQPPLFPACAIEKVTETTTQLKFTKPTGN